MGASLQFNAASTHRFQKDTGCTGINAVSYSMSIWFNRLSGGSGDRMIMEMSSGTTYVNWCHIWHNTLKFRVGHSYTSSSSTFEADFVVPANTWTHAAWSHNSNSPSTKPTILINGVQQTVNTIVTGSGTVRSGTVGYRFGGRRFLTSFNSFDGRLAYAQFWPSLLSVNELADTYHRPGSYPKGMTLYVPMVLPSSQLDISGSGNHESGNNGYIESSDGPPVTPVF